MTTLLETACHLNDAIDKLTDEIVDPKYDYEGLEQKFLLLDCLEKVRQAKLKILKLDRQQEAQKKQKPKSKK